MDTGFAALLISLTVIVLFFFIRKSRGKGDGPMISLVYLLKEPRRVSERIVRELASGALGITFEEGNSQATQFVVTLPVLPSENVRESEVQRYLLKINEGAYMVNIIGAPYVQDPYGFADGIVDERLRSAVATHCGWISVDAMTDALNGEEKADAYKVIGKMMAALADDDCLAIYCPELERCNEYDDTVLDKLRLDYPLALFEEPTHAPIVNVDGDDSHMVVAVEEARARWPEFVAAFDNEADPEKPFLIKAEFQQDGCSEFMWVSVKKIEKDSIEGVLENTPHKLKNLKEGQAVTVELSSLNDWIFLKNDEGVGGFTMKVIKEQLEPGC